MTLPGNFVAAIYKDPGIERYRGNPFVEALPPIMSVQQIRKQLTGKVKYNPRDAFSNARERAHEVAALLDDFFQPIGSHLHLEEKISIMIRGGYVGRNLEDGSLNTHMQNGYERIMTGKLDCFRFAQTNSTAKSLSLIGCSGSGKSTTINRILATYPQVIFHEKHNFIQISYLRIECPYNGSLKSLCLNFFRQLDRVLHTNYEEKYTRKRFSTEVLLALMSQAANKRAVGILVIDEIQRLSRRRSGGKEKMLEFFVELVNVIGVPVVMVGTPKARPIFELELQSGRRSAGFGSLFWEPMRAEQPKRDAKTGKLQKTEWMAFTDKLWRYQWLLKRDEVLPDEIRDCWFDLSQGVLDIVVKIFVLAQLRAIAMGVERITVKLLKRVYQDELKPVHPMLEALRSGDAEKIAKYSDLKLDNTDKRILELKQKIDEMMNREDKVPSFQGNEQAMRLYHLLVAMDCDAELLPPLIEQAFKDYPQLTIRELMPVVLEWYEKPVKPKAAKKRNKIPQKSWHTLDSDDLRFKFSQADKDKVYDDLTYGSELFDLPNWIKRVG
ncbi:AAA family ATPase [Thalassomonas viridans]|uniref:AAA family ATPase n=1 Tax=Thalassomonas viridans TaxID=137584 RepID=A0AAE9Z268_9GAMM|nr:AAA family ATPase [Thalassomonas viridans]WDE05426.1 AAA family ATPase [Thalassomonas viridans]